MDADSREPPTHGRLAAVLGFCAVAGVLAIDCWKWYQDGLGFAKGLHVFGMFNDVFVIALVALAGILFMWVSVFLAPRGERKKIAIPSVIGTIVCVGLVLSSILFMGESFRRGRVRAYQQADHTTLAAACGSIGAYNQTAATPIQTQWYQPKDFAKLPASLTSLNPKEVAVGARGTIVWMDGGGPAAHEGFYVPIAPLKLSPQQFATQHGLTVLSVNPPVFHFFLYDCRMLPFE